MDKLLFRRQFVLGPRFVERLNSWNRAKINDYVYLTVQPDLPLHHVVHDSKSLTLLGYILDPFSPELSDDDILNQLIRQVGDADDIFQYTDNLGGRWILIFNDGQEMRLFNDAGGLRQVFYTNKPYQEMWCASQPGMLAEELNLEIDKEALDGFINTPTYMQNKEHWWPGDSSPYKEIKHLLPNHYLDLKTGTCYRYWPKKKLNHISLEEGVEKSAEILRGLIKSASNRFNLAFAITAGWDTRLLLAASKDVSKSIYYYTLIYYNLTEDSLDIVIPSKLLRQLGLEHHIIKCPSHMSNEFREIYERNVPTAHEAFGNINQGLYEKYPQDRVSIKGVISSEVVKTCTLTNIENGRVQTLARCLSMRNNSFAARYLEAWLSEAREIAGKYNIGILELSGWEQLTGNWQAMGLLESDIVQEVFVPYNCRNLLVTMLSIEKKYRRPPDHVFYQKLIMNMWPEALAQPINPVSLYTVILHGNLLSINELVEVPFIARLLVGMNQMLRILRLKK